MKKKILAIGAHPDDIELGCGASIANFYDKNYEVTALIFSNCNESLKKGLAKDTLLRESFKSLRHLGKKIKIKYFDFPVRKFNFYRQDILDCLIKYNEKKFDYIFVNSLRDIHQDHKVISEETLRAFKNQNILFYQFPWNLKKIIVDVTIEVKERHVKKKIKSLSFYKSQIHRHYFRKENIITNLKWCGQFSETTYSEVFEINKISL